MPAAKLQVATHTRRVPASYAAAMRSRSSLVKPAYRISQRLLFLEKNGIRTSLIVIVSTMFQSRGILLGTETYGETQRHTRQFPLILDQLPY